MTTVVPEPLPASDSRRSQEGAPGPAWAVELRDVVKRYPRRRSWREILGRRPVEWDTALDRVSFAVRPGEIFGLLGPNGAGKTSLLKILSTLIVPDDGTASIDGRDVVTHERHARGAVAACLANERSLYWRLSARENLEVFADLVGVPRAERDARVRELLEGFGLQHTGRKFVAQFSSGMMQRLVVARALLRRPRVLLLDEPTRSMDPVAARDFRETLRRELVHARDCAVILATHATEEALELCDRAAVISRGRILAEGSVEELGRRYLGIQLKLWTSVAPHPAFGALDSTLRVASMTPDSATGGADGWTVVTIDGVADLDGAARLLRSLVDGGVPIARFEFVPLTLASLIDRVVRSAAPDEDVARP